MDAMAIRARRAEVEELDMLPLLPKPPAASFELNFARAFEGLTKCASDIIKDNPLLDFDLEGAFPAPCTLARRLEEQDRWLGMRDGLTRNHWVVEKLKTSLTIYREHVPAPDQATIARLQHLGCVDILDNVCSLDGVPIPAGPSQISFFVVLRWQWLFHPLAQPWKVYVGNVSADRVFATDHLQEAAVGLSLKRFRDQLIATQAENVSFFASLWLRRFDEAERILRACTDGVVLVEGLFKFAMKRGAKEQIVVAASIMSEWERLFELADRLKFSRGVTRETVLKALEKANSWSDILSLTTDVGTYLVGCAASLRAIHRTMNSKPSADSETCTLALVREAITNSPVFQDRYRRIAMVSGQRPVLFFAGVELAKFLPVMLEQMFDNLARHRTDGGKVSLVHRVATDRRRNAMLLSMIVTSNVCQPTAQVMALPIENKPPRETQGNSC